MFSEYAKVLEGRVKERYLQKISVIGVYPASIPTDQFSPECLPPVEVSDLLSYLVLELLCKPTVQGFQESRGVQPSVFGICDLSCGQTNRRKICCKSTCATLSADE